MSMSLLQYPMNVSPISYLQVAVGKDRFYTGDSSYYKLEPSKQMKWTRIQGAYKVWIADGHSVKVETNTCTTVVVVFPDRKFIVKRHDDIASDVATTNLITETINDI